MKRIGQLFGTLVILIVLLGGATAWWAMRPLTLASQTVDISIEPQTTVSGIAQVVADSGVDVEPVRDQGDLVDQRDVEIALRVFNHLGRFGNANGGRRKDPCLDDGRIQGADLFERRRIVARHHLDDARERVFLVAGIDALGREAEEEILAALEPGRAGDARTADVLGDAGIDGRLVDHDVALLEMRADRRRGALERLQIGLLAGVDRRRNGHDVEVRGGEILRIGGEFQPRRLERGRIDLARPVVAPGQFGDPPCIDVESDDGRTGAGKGRGDRQADIAQADHADAFAGQRRPAHASSANAGVVVSVFLPSSPIETLAMPKRSARCR